MDISKEEAIAIVSLFASLWAFKSAKPRKLIEAMPKIHWEVTNQFILDEQVGIFCWRPLLLHLTLTEEYFLWNFYYNWKCKINENFVVEMYDIFIGQLGSFLESTGILPSLQRCFDYWRGFLVSTMVYCMFNIAFLFCLPCVWVQIFCLLIHLLLIIQVSVEPLKNKNRIMDHHEDDCRVGGDHHGKQDGEVRYQY